MPRKSPTPAPPSARIARRRTQTRGRLLRAACELMASRGTHAPSIQEITDRADVAFGSFYSHFKSKEEIADAVLEEITESFGVAADRLSLVLDDPAEVLAASARHAIARAAADQSWGWFVVRTALTRSRMLSSTLGTRLARDIRVGMEAGRFRTPDPVAIAVAVGGTILASISARLTGEMGDDAPERAATVVLTILGLPAEEAAAVARRPLPAMDIPQA